MKQKYWLKFFAVPPLIFLGIFYFYPLIKILILSFISEGKWNLYGIKKLFSTTYYFRILWFTFWQASVSTILTIILAVPGAYVFARYKFWGKNFLQAFTAIPFVLPTVVVAAAFQAFLGPQGLLNIYFTKWFNLSSAPISIDQTVWFILLAHVFYNYTIVFRLVGGFWSNIETNLNDAACILGASSFKIFYKITLPLLWPVICTSGILVFIFCFSSFGVILILGGPKFSTIEVEIYRQAVNLFNLPMAATLSIIQIMFTFCLMWAYTALQRKNTVYLNPESITKTQKPVIYLKDKIIVSANIIFMFIFLILPLIALVFRSFCTENGFSPAYYAALFDNQSQSLFFVPPLNAVLNSLFFAFATLIMAVILGTMGALFLAKPENRFSYILDPVFMLPLSTSAVTLGFGFIIALDKPPLNLRTSLILVPISHTLVAFPFVIRSLLPALRSIPASLREAASLLGASPFQVWKSVDMPILARAMMVGAVFAFTISLGEFGATVFVARPQTPTMPLAIYRFLGQPGSVNYGQALAMSTLLMLVTGTGFMFLEKIKITQTREF